jgi:hypothetical protein
VAQKNVQLIIGRVLTDEEFRADFLERTDATLASLRDQGFELTNIEVDALTLYGWSVVALWRRVD